jgi:hypothetical protein
MTARNAAGSRDGNADPIKEARRVFPRPIDGGPPDPYPGLIKEAA